MEKKKKGRPKHIGSSENVSSTPDVAPKLPRGVEKQISEIRLGLTGLLEGSGRLVSQFNAFDGAVILGGSSALVDAICRAAAQNAPLRHYLTTLVHASAWGDICMASAMIILPILANHRLVPDKFNPFLEEMPEMHTNGYHAPAMARN